MDAARTPRPRRALALAALVAASAGVLVGAGSGTAGASASTVDGAAARRSHELVDSARAQVGLAPLVQTPEADRVATDWALRMAGSARLQHNPDLSSQLRGWSLIAENVGVGADAEQVHGAFMESPGHRDNVLRQDVTEIGLGAVRSPDGLVWIVQVFELPAGVTAPERSPLPAAVPVARPLPAPAVQDAPRLERATRDRRG